MFDCSFMVNLEKLQNCQMPHHVSTDNGTQFQKMESVIFCDDYVQYHNDLLFFEAIIDCCMYSATHSVLVDSCKII
jgi:hypothetical protein